ncbi:DUF4238 domain-containing protein [Nitrosococcus watsonii]|uniref:DUF4238 domain-containing protein n=1 Tax=Nitrosococcus watsoni (strain C-113) TaxID=105559 RepID=D8KBG6_NITWC|nr:DUF4238 domain-containing protein [Nitrosococcus watsonii]ADJ29613.1 conserved hypothetical protein [Nitrosococcus watsonii C-113]
MPTNKNQHFVPRCYLRPFSHEESGKAIRVFNIDREQIIEGAAVKHQCSGSYFYGEDKKLEAAIQSIEQKYADTLRRVREPSYNGLGTDDELILKRFWLLQYLRTEAASRRAVEMNNQLGELIGADSSFNLEIRAAVLMAMRVFANEMEVIDDLKVCLIKNNTETPFIASDDPAILANRWFQTDNQHRGSTFGLASAGALAILPLCRNLMFIAYDSDVYSILKNAGIVRTKRESDVQSLNQLQFLNCRANIFPGQMYDHDALRQSFQACVNNRLEKSHVLHYSVLDQTNGDYKRYRVIDSPDDEDHQEALVHSQTLHSCPQNWPLLLRWRKKGFGMVNGTGIGCIRRSQIDERRGPSFKRMNTGR